MTDMNQEEMWEMIKNEWNTSTYKNYCEPTVVCSFYDRARKFFCCLDSWWSTPEPITTLRFGDFQWQLKSDNQMERTTLSQQGKVGFSALHQSLKWNIKVYYLFFTMELILSPVVSGRCLLCYAQCETHDLSLAFSRTEPVYFVCLCKYKTGEFRMCV